MGMNNGLLPPQLPGQCSAEFVHVYRVERTEEDMIRRHRQFPEPMLFPGFLRKKKIDIVIAYNLVGQLRNGGDEITRIRRCIPADIKNI